MHMRSVGNTVAATIPKIVVQWISGCINSDPFSPKGTDMLLELLEDGLMIVFVLVLADGVTKECPSMMTFVAGLVTLGTLLAV